MTKKVSEYIHLLTELTHGKIDPTEFRDLFIEKFKSEKITLSESEFGILDQLFGDADSFTEDVELMKSMPGFYINGDQLKERAAAALVALTEGREGS